MILTPSVSGKWSVAFHGVSGMDLGNAYVPYALRAMRYVVTVRLIGTWYGMWLSVVLPTSRVLPPSPMTPLDAFVAASM